MNLQREISEIDWLNVFYAQMTIKYTIRNYKIITEINQKIMPNLFWHCIWHRKVSVPIALVTNTF